MVLSFTDFLVILCFEFDDCTGGILRVLEPDECCFELGGLSFGAYGACYPCYY